MRNRADLLGMPVTSLQEMLRTLSAVYPDIPALVPNGNFGPYTLEGVMVFQREKGLPVTGRVEHDTWKVLVEEYEEAVRGQSPTFLYPGGDTVLQVGQEAPILYPIQGMFCALAGVLENFSHETPTGKYSAITAANTRALQRSAGREETGHFDRAAWESLTRLYETFLKEPDFPL